MADLQEDLKKAAYEFVVQVHLPRGLASLLPKLRVCPLLPCLRCTSSPPSHLCSAFSPHYRSTWRTAHSTLPVILPMTTICVGRAAGQQSSRAGDEIASFVTQSRIRVEAFLYHLHLGCSGIKTKGEANSFKGHPYFPPE